MQALSNRACPYCRNLKTSRSHRHRGVERYLLRVVGILPHRCTWIAMRASTPSRGLALVLRLLAGLREPTRRIGGRLHWPNPQGVSAPRFFSGYPRMLLRNPILCSVDSVRARAWEHPHA